MIQGLKAQLIQKHGLGRQWCDRCAVQSCGWFGRGKASQQATGLSVGLLVGEELPKFQVPVAVRLQFISRAPVLYAGKPGNSTLLAVSKLHHFAFVV